MPTAGPTILIVDDHQVLRHGLAALLQAEDWVGRIVEGSTVAEGAELAVRERPQLAVVDLGLPVANIYVTDLAGVVYRGRAELMDPDKARFARETSARTLSDVIEGADVFLGLSAGGVLKPGDEVMVLPSGFTSRIESIDTADGPVDEAYPPMSVTVRLEDNLDVSRGDMVCRRHNQPLVTQDVDAMVCWMDAGSGLRAGQKLAVKHTTRSVRALVKDLQYRLDINTLHRDEHASGLALNEIGRVTLRTTVPLFYDEYRRNRATGSFILIDEGTNSTVGAGMILGPTQFP